MQDMRGDEFSKEFDRVYAASLPQARRGLHRHRERDDLRLELDKAGKEIRELQRQLSAQTGLYLDSIKERCRLEAENAELRAKICGVEK